MFSNLLPLLNISPSCSILFPAPWATSPHLSAASRQPSFPALGFSASLRPQAPRCPLPGPPTVECPPSHDPSALSSRSPRPQATYVNGGLPATQHIKQESLPDYRAVTEACAPPSAHCRAPSATGPHTDLDLPGRGLATPAPSCYLLGSEPSSGLGPPPEAHLPEGGLKRCCLLGLPPTSSVSVSPCAASDITSIIRSSQTALVTCVNGLRSPPLPGDTGGPPKRARPSSASAESHEGSLRLEACRKAGFLKQEPADEFSELFGPGQQGLPPPYPLSQLPPGPGLGGLGLGLAGRGLAGRQACRWVDCCAAYEQQEELVRHIEKSHIDQRKGEDFTCFWAGCVRRYKPFNARYKLLIHMRVHSGEKPNKCMVSSHGLRLCPHSAAPSSLPWESSAWAPPLGSGRGHLAGRGKDQSCRCGHRSQWSVPHSLGTLAEGSSDSPGTLFSTLCGLVSCALVQVVTHVIWGQSISAGLLSNTQMLSVPPADGQVSHGEYARPGSGSSLGVTGLISSTEHRVLIGIRLESCGCPGQALG